MQQASPASNEVRLPRAVVERSKRIDDMLKAQREAEADPVVETPPAAVPGATAAPPVEPQPPKVTAAEDPRHSDPLYWKQRFDVMNGILSREREQTAGTIEGLYQRIDELEGQVATLQASPQPSSSKIDLGKYFTPEQIERLGEDEALSMAATAEKASQEAAKAAIEQMAALLKPEQKRRERQEAGDTERKKREYKEAILAKYPDFDAMDVADDWIAYLQNFYGSTDITRQQILDRYIGAFNVPKTIEFIEDFLKTRDRPTPPVAPQASGASSNGGTPPAVPSGLKAPSNIEVRDFYKRAKLGKVTDQERTDFEARQKLRAAS